MNGLMISYFFGNIWAKIEEDIVKNRQNLIPGLTKH